MKVKNEVLRRWESEMDGLFILPCGLICSNASLSDKYSYTNASVISQSAASLLQGHYNSPASALLHSFCCRIGDEFVSR